MRKSDLKGHQSPMVWLMKGHFLSTTMGPQSHREPRATIKEWVPRDKDESHQADGEMEVWERKPLLPVLQSWKAQSFQRASKVRPLLSL